MTYLCHAQGKQLCINYLESKLAASLNGCLQPTVLIVILVWLRMPHSQQAGLFA